ncbi:amine GPCR [Schistosoma japonicum]|uniref:Amine GPCR n=1 Tax=Schistosoma japonicum TaxID=6182 RepID=A0A4Z2CWS4_SCHJA|nr:amine GPCR [Schistosoma japonicum]
MNGTVYVTLPIRITIIVEGVIGTIFNIIAIVVIFKVSIGSKFTTFLLRTQSILDLSACLSAATYNIIQSTDHYNEPTGLYTIDLLICHLWFRNAAFWLSCILSVQNLVCISLDRVSSVIILGSRKSYTTKFFILYFVYMLCMFLILYLPTPLLRRYTGIQCIMDFSFPWIDTKVFLDYIVYSWIVFAYFLPVIVMLLSHVWVIYTIKKSQSPSQGDMLRNTESNMKIKRKLIQLVITTAIVSLQQAILHSFECINQILIICEVIMYSYGTPMEQMGTVLILFGCSSNPCIFVFSMAALRKRLLLLFKCKVEKMSSFGTTDAQSKSFGE